jgi:hypothetical protein
MDQDARHIDEQIWLRKDLNSNIGLNVKKIKSARLQELEEMAAKLLETARKLPPGADYQNALQEIGRFLARIDVLKEAD